METNNMPKPDQTAYAKLKSKYLSAIIKTLKEIPQKINVNIEGYNFVKPYDNFIQVEPPSSVKMPIVKSNHFIRASLLFDILPVEMLIIRFCSLF